MSDLDTNGTAEGPAPRISVLICTRDRADSLARTLASLAAMASIDRPWELVIVDNGGSDHTPEIVSRFADVLPVRTVREERAGLSNARNAGVAAARGDYIVWTDDDVLVHPGWLAAYARAFAEHPEDAVFGGRTVPVYEAPERTWFTRGAAHLQSLLAVRDEPSWDRITPERVPYGLNYAVRTAEQRRHLYDPDLGVAPGRRRGGEETAVVRAILAEGATGRWVWEAGVDHLIPSQRQSAGYIYRFYRAQGFDHPVTSHARAGAKGRALVRVGALGLRKASLLAVRRIVGDPRWVASLTGLARVHGSLDRLRAGS